MSAWLAAAALAAVASTTEASRASTASPKCFGAAAHDLKRPCRNETRSVYPGSDDPAFNPSSPCENIGNPRLDVCEFGSPKAKARRHIALMGDSHAVHWRAALDVVADATESRGLSLTAPGCPFSRAVENLLVGAAAPCTDWYNAVIAWFKDHREVSTVFVSQNVTTPIVVPPGKTEEEIRVAGFQRAWRALPKSVKRVFVIKDTPDPADSTLECVQGLIAVGTERPGPACATPRADAVRRDTAVSAAKGLRSARYRVIDLTDFFCDERDCLPVIGGVLVYNDIFGHITAAYSRTLAPYVLRRVSRWMPAR